MKHRGRILSALLLVLGLPPWAAAQSVVWTVLDVKASLDNEGRLHVVETHDLELKEGGGFKLSLPFGLGVDQGIAFGGLTRLGPDSAEVALQEAKGDVEGPDQYRYYPLGHVYFSIPELPSGTSLAYRMEYELLNALSPAWAIAAGKGPLERPATIHYPLAQFRQVVSDLREAWPGRDGLYRLDHDVLFPSRQGPGFAVRRIDYQLHYDTAWRLVDPDAELATIQADEDYRVRRLFERVDGAAPSAVDQKAPRLRWAVLGALLLAVPVLWLLLLAAEAVGSRLAGPTTFEGMQARLSSLAPEALAALSGGGWSTAPQLESVLSRMAGERKIAIEVEAIAPASQGPEPSEEEEDDDEPQRLVRIRRLVPLEGLPDFEREVLSHLLVDGRRDVTSAQLQDLHAEQGLDPGQIVSDVLPSRSATPPRSWLASLLWLLSLGGVALQLSSLESSDLFPLVLIGDLAVLFLLRAWPRGYWHGGQRWPAAIALLVPGLLASALATALLFSISPSMAPQGYLGTAAAALAAYAALLAGARRPWRGEPHALVRDLGRIRRYAKRELRRAQPRLEDRFLPHLEALGLGKHLEAWRQSVGQRRRRALVEPARRHRGRANAACTPVHRPPHRAVRGSTAMDRRALRPLGRGTARDGRGRGGGCLKYFLKQLAPGRVDSRDVLGGDLCNLRGSALARFLRVLRDPRLDQLPHQGGRQGLLGREAHGAHAGFVLRKLALVCRHRGPAHGVEGAVALPCSEGHQQLAAQPEGRDAVADALLGLRRDGLDGLAQLLERRSLVGPQWGKVVVDGLGPGGLGLGGHGW